MAFFGNGLFNDPFFGDMHRMMRNQMRELDALLDPFGMMGGNYVEDRRNRPARQQMIEDESGRDYTSRGRNANRSQDPVIPYQERDPMNSLLTPFGFGLGHGLFGGLMRQMGQMQSQAMNDPNSHVFTQSTVISMAPGEDGRPKYYEATESVRRAGDVKETRRTVRDTDRGLEQMEIGHHIGRRGHVIEKRRDRNTGSQIVENQQFIGLKEDQAQQFDQEWSRATRAFHGEHYLDSERGTEPRLAIEGARSRRGKRGPFYAKSVNSDQQSQSKSTNQPRIEEPEEPPYKKIKDKSAKKTGPTIVEID